MNATTHTTGDLTGLLAILPEAVDAAMRRTLPDFYTPQLAAAIAADVEFLARERGTTTRTCPVYRDCSMTEPGHYDHGGHDMEVLDERDGSTVLDAGMVALSGDEEHVIAYVGVAEYTDLDALKAKTQELRRFLDEVDAMAGRVFADQAAKDLR